MKHQFMKKVYFRFYAELNDFLAVENQQHTFAYHFWGSPSVKDAIQALGVPHTEVSLVLVNSTAVDLSYRLLPGDRVSVYPVFRSIDMPGAGAMLPRPMGGIKFIADSHLGKLSRYLRMLGFDVFYDNQFDDAEIIDLSIKDNRVILTRDLGILKNSKVTSGYFLRSQAPQEQVREVVRRFDLIDHFAPFSRCMECNGKLKEVNKTAVIHQLQPQTLNDFNEFFECQGCAKVYWKGSHYDRMWKMIDQLV